MEDSELYSFAKELQVINNFYNPNYAINHTNILTPYRFLSICLGRLPSWDDCQWLISLLVDWVIDKYNKSTIILLII